MHLKEQFAQYEDSVRWSFVVPSQTILVDGDLFSKHWKAINKMASYELYGSILHNPSLQKPQDPIWKYVIYNLLEAEFFTVDANLKASVCILSEVIWSTAHRGCQ